MQGKPGSIDKSKQLLVEGEDENQFFGALLDHLENDEIQVQSYGGKDNLRRFLKAFLNVPIFDEVQSIGIVRDADTDAATAFKSVQNSLTSVELPVPDEMLAPATGALRVGIFIMPDNSNPGALEDLCLNALEGDLAIGCVSDFIQCIQDSVQKVPKNMAKARMHAFLASREDPELRLGIAAHRGYLPWGNAAFGQLIEFVKGV